MVRRRDEMKAGVVTTGKRDSARVIEMPVPVPEPGEALIRLLEIGIDGTDMEISQGRYGEQPPGQDFLVLALTWLKAIWWYQW